jgi:hypothetical protein
MFHIGSRIKEVFDSQPKEHDVNWFADKLCCNRRNIYKIFKRQNIDILLLKRISEVLDHDFFEDMRSSSDISDDNSNS